MSLGKGISEEPLDYIVSTSHLSSNCSHCLKASPTLKRCSGCHRLYFCNRECQRGSWSVHASECSALRSLGGSRVPPDTPRLLGRLLLRLSARPEEAERRGGPDWPQARTLNSLMDHGAEVAKDPLRLEHLASLLQVLKVYLGADRLPSAQQIKGLYGKIVVNGFSILDQDMNPVGLGLYPALSGFDHSCRPNAVVTFAGPTATLRLLKPVDDVRAVRVSYCDVLSPTAERQRQLSAQFYFTCSCEGCADVALDGRKLGLRCPSCGGVASELGGCGVCRRPLSLEEAEAASFALGKAAWDLEDLEKESKTEIPNHAEILKRSEEVLESVERYADKESVCRVRCLERAMDAATELQLWAKVAELGRSLLPPYERFYDEHHPNLCLHRTKLAKLLLLLGEAEEAREQLTKACASAEVCLGSAHELRASIASLLCEAEESLRVGLDGRQRALTSE